MSFAKTIASMQSQAAIIQEKYDRYAESIDGRVEPIQFLYITIWGCDPAPGWEERLARLQELTQDLIDRSFARYGFTVPELEFLPVKHHELDLTYADVQEGEPQRVIRRKILDSFPEYKSISVQCVTRVYDPDSSEPKPIWLRHGWMGEASGIGFTTDRADMALDTSRHSLIRQTLHELGHAMNLPHCAAQPFEKEHFGEGTSLMGRGYPQGEAHWLNYADCASLAAQACVNEDTDEKERTGRLKGLCDWNYVNGVISLSGKFYTTPYAGEKQEPAYVSVAIAPETGSVWDKYDQVHYLTIPDEEGSWEGEVDLSADFPDHSKFILRCYVNFPSGHRKGRPFPMKELNLADFA